MAANQKYTVLDADGFPVGFWSVPDAHKLHELPANAIKITDAQWGEFISNPVGARKLVNGQVVTVADYVPPPPPVPEIISDRQFFQQLAIEGIITPQEALDAVRTGAIPAKLQGYVDSITDPNARFSAEMLLSGAVEFHRDHPLTEAIGKANGLTDSDIDEFFRKAAQL